MEATLLKSVVVHEVKHIVGTLLHEELEGLENTMSDEERGIFNKILDICKAELDSVTDPELLHQKAHTVIAGTLIALATSVEHIELHDTEPSGLMETMKNAYLCIRSVFSSSK